MEWQSWVTVGVLAALLIGIARELATPDVALAGGLLALGASGVLSPQETFAGFANPVLPAVAGLLVLSAALRETGALDVCLQRAVGGASTETEGTTRLAPVLAVSSAFLNNVTLVALTTPWVRDWARRRRLSPSRMLLPMDYATVLGSVTTAIGTSTTLVVSALLVETGYDALGLFEISPAGIPVCIIGLLYLRFAAPRLLPERRDPVDDVGARRREYTAAMIVEQTAPFIASTVEEARLRQLPGLFLVEIDRGGRIITPVGPEQRLEAGDRLVFAGAVATLIDLQRMPGLAPADESANATPPHGDRRLVEAVVSSNSRLVRRSIRDANFRTVYDAAVIAVHRSGERVGGKIGAIELRPGDTLLLQTAPGFLRAHGDSADFYLVSEVARVSPARRDRAGVALLLLAGTVAAVASGAAPLALAAPVAAALSVACRCLSIGSARASVDWSVLVAIGSGLGLATALDKTGVAHSAAQFLVESAGALGPIAALAAVYLCVLLLSELLNHTAAAAIGVPIAVAAALELGTDPRAFAVAVALGASCSFALPMSYQTHLIVYGPGGYRPRDFLRAGLPLDALCAAVALLLIPLLWPL